jgi:hypothetical protein
MAGVGKAGTADTTLRALSSLPFESVAAFDRLHFGFERERFLRRWIVPEGGRGIGALGGETLRGVGVIRPCREGFKIGPLFANNASVAERIFAALSAHAAGKPLYLDTPENNPEAIALAARHGMTEVFGCARMYNGPAPQLPWDRIYGITTFELG